jgi:hypothetical protein
MSKTDDYLNAAFAALGIGLDDTAESKYARLEEIIHHLQGVDSGESIDKAVTGNISERLCELALKAAMNGRYDRMSQDWHWLADFSLQGNPFNVLVSVKSFKARERLIASGARSLLTPTVGWGVFDDPTEWNEGRVRSYIFSGFSAIYMPRSTLEATSDRAREVVNANGNPLLRQMGAFLTDITSWLDSQRRIDIRRI